jgi:hypothetical protein
MYDSILMGDQVLTPRKLNSPYPLPVANPRWETYQDEPWPGCFVTLGFLAAATRRVRLGTGVLILPYRHPAIVAKLVATLDYLSGGRINFAHKPLANLWQTGAGAPNQRMQATTYGLRSCVASASGSGSCPAFGGEL